MHRNLQSVAGILHRIRTRVVASSNVHVALKAINPMTYLKRLQHQDNKAHVRHLHSGIIGLEPFLAMVKAKVSGTMA